MTIRKQPLFLFLFCICSVSESCIKSGSSFSGAPKPGDYGTHYIDSELEGEWLWTSVDNLGRYDSYGYWQGSGDGSAFDAGIEEDGDGFLYNHVSSNVAPGKNFTEDTYYVGYYEMDSSQALTFYVKGGYYTNSDGVQKPVTGSDIYQPSTGAGKKITFSNLIVTMDNQPVHFTALMGNGEKLIFYKL